MKIIAERMLVVEGKVLWTFFYVLFLFLFIFYFYSGQEKFKKLCKNKFKEFPFCCK